MYITRSTGSLEASSEWLGHLCVRHVSKLLDLHFSSQEILSLNFSFKQVGIMQFLQHEGPLRSFELQFSLGMRMHCNSITVVLFLNYSSFSWEYHCFIHNSIWFFIHSYWWLVSYIHCWISVSGYSSNLWLHLSFYRWILYSLVNPRVLCHHSDDLYWRRPQFY